MWFWRGTQSAIFYYVTLSPCMEARHKRKRRKEAKLAEKNRAELELLQPEVIRQPLQFQTNKYWAEEVLAGPGPPKGWKRESFDGSLEIEGSKNNRAQNPTNRKQKSALAPPSGSVRFAAATQRTASSTEATKPQTRPQRPSLDQKQSTLDNLRDTLRSSLSPDTWNWKRYEREDEPLWGLNETISRMWDRARPSTSHRGSTTGSGEHRRSFSLGRPRAGTVDSDRYDYNRARIPEVNDLHPPVVSQLPATRAEVAWMLQPPPSRAMMEGKIPAGREDMSLRRPLAIIGSTVEEDRRRGRFNRDEMLFTEKTRNRVTNRKGEVGPSIWVGPEEIFGTEGDEIDSEDDSDKLSDNEIKPTRSSSLPPIHFARPPSIAGPSNTKRNSGPIQRPALAVIAAEKPSHSFHSLILPTPSPKLNSRSPSPIPPYLDTSENSKIESASQTAIVAPPEWDYLLEVCLPQMPPRTRSSLPNGVWV